MVRTTEEPPRSVAPSGLELGFRSCPVRAGPARRGHVRKAGRSRGIPSRESRPKRGEPVLPTAPPYAPGYPRRRVDLEHGGWNAGIEVREVAPGGDILMIGCTLGQRLRGMTPRDLPDRDPPSGASTGASD